MEDRVDTRNRVLRTASQIFGVPEHSLSETSSPESIEGWDSLKHMNLVLALEEQFGVRFSDDQIMAMSSVCFVVMPSSFHLSYSWLRAAS